MPVVNCSAWSSERGNSPPASRHSPKTVSPPDRKSTRLNSSHVRTSYAVFCLKKKQVVRLQVLVEHDAGDAGVGDQGQFQAALEELGEGVDDVGGEASVVGDGGIHLPSELAAR